MLLKWNSDKTALVASFHDQPGDTCDDDE
jgi:hypothetical protein